MPDKNENKISLTRQSLLFSIIVILFLTLSNGIMTYFGQVRAYEADLESSEKSYLERELDASRAKTQNIKSYIDNESALSEESLRAKAKSIVSEAHNIAFSLYEKNKNEMEEAELKKLIKNVVESLKYDDEPGYNFIGGMDGTIIMLPSMPGLEGSNILGLKDAEGAYPVQNAIKIASSPEKKGYMKWNWYKPGEAGEMYEKIGYVMYFEPYDWFIGTGEYIYNSENTLKTKVLETLEKIYRNAEQYVFIGGSDGNVLMAPYEIDNFYDLGKSGEMYVWDIIKGLPFDSEGFVDYTLPESALGYSYSKTSYVLYVPEWDWYVGTGIDLDFLDSQNLQRIEELKNILIQNFLVSILISLVTFLIAMYLFAYYNRNLDKEFSMMNDFLSSAPGKYRELDVSRFKYRELHHLASTANQMILKIRTQRVELEKYSKRMKQLARTDSLTGLLNHNAIMQNAQSRMHEADRYHAPLSAIMLDIDDFKKINDTYGHQFGDEVLVRVSSIFNESLRETDIIGRYGGEEFLILLPNTNLDNAWQVAEKIRKAVESSIWDVEELTVTLSGGVSEYAGKHSNRMIGDADKKLYKAKSMGKNRMVK
ncbi:MAG TPA: cache domain-containing protein [Clostridia bacterium]|nr:cache domain-containing protein [Clostridia bacterium]